MPEDHNPESGRDRVNVELRLVVPDIDRYHAELDHIKYGDRIRPRSPVVVTADYRDRRQSPQRLQDIGRINVARVDDVLAPVERRQRFIPDQPVRVGEGRSGWRLSRSL